MKITFVDNTNGTELATITRCSVPAWHDTVRLTMAHGEEPQTYHVMSVVWDVDAPSGEYGVTVMLEGRG